jgi:Helix-hairpin-helix domain
MTTPVNKVSGIGPKTTEFLKNQGIATAEALITSGVAKLALAPGFNQSRATTVINAASKLISEPQLQATSRSTAKSSSKAKTKPEKIDKKDKKNKKNKDKKSKGKKGKDKKSKKDKKDKKKNKK